MTTKKSGRKPFHRSLFTESLENRVLMASDAFHNFLEPHDVNDDRFISPIDALQVINRLNSHQASPTHHAFEDVNDDGLVSPLDALLIINNLNTATPQSKVIEPIKVVESATSSAKVRVEVETEGMETELSIRVESAAAGTKYAVTLNDIALGEILTDSRGRGQVKLSQGDDNRNHLPLPPSVMPLSSDMELVIGDLVKGKLSTVARFENQTTGGGSTDDNSNDDNSSNDNSNDDNSNDDSNDDNSSNDSSTEVHLVAAFPVAGKIVRSAEFESETEGSKSKSKFKAEIEKAAPNTTFAVKVSGVQVGTITTDSRGKGKLILSTQPKDGKELPMPANFPQVAVGTEVMIGELASQWKLQA